MFRLLIVFALCLFVGCVDTCIPLVDEQPSDNPYDKCVIVHCSGCGSEYTCCGPNCQPYCPACQGDR